jgi:hypothetical protein
MESTRREPALGRFLLRIHRNRLGDLPPVAAAAITLSDKKRSYSPPDMRTS